MAPVFVCSHDRRIAFLAQGERGQHVGAFVLGVAGMALDPVPVDLVRRQRLFQALP